MSAEVLTVGKERYVLNVFNDITLRKQVEEKLTYQALHDPLTGLPNRTLFMEHLERMFHYAQRHSESGLAVLFLDLDRFKVVNDSLGHMAGDELLVAVAARTKNVLRQTDVVARLGGDEFLIALDGLPSIREAEEISARILHEIRKPILLSGHDFVVTASIGIAPARPEYASPKELARDADIAMYRAKESGPDKYAVFEASMRQKVLSLIELEADLRRAVQNQEFELYFQEIHNLAERVPVGFEALLRWHHPTGLRMPKQFLQVAEDAGLMNEIGPWVLRTACRQLASDRALGGTARINVNVSGSQFSDARLLGCVEEALAESGLAPSQLILEITETVIMDNLTVVASLIRDLQALGVGVQIDDFGSGYSSLTRLLNLPITGLKIGPTFVSSMQEDNGAASIVRAVVGLAHGLNLSVTAEGIETAGQLEYLRGIGCDFGQGYYLSPPKPAHEAFHDSAGLIRALP